MSSWKGRLVASIPIAALFTAAIIGAAYALGWLDFDREFLNSELGLGILFTVLGEMATGALIQLISETEAGPEVLVGPVLVLIALTAIVIATGDRSLRSVGGGALFVLIAQVKLGSVATRMTWTLKP